MSDYDNSQRSGRQTVFSVLGFLGFAALIPLVLKSLGIGGPAEFLATNLGMWASPGFILIYFYAFPLLDVIFGTDRKLAPILAGALVSFLVFAIAVPLPFMDWYRPLFKDIPFLACSLGILVVGMLAMFLGLLLSYVRRRLPGSLMLLLVVILPIGALCAAAWFRLDLSLGLPLYPL